VEKLDPAYEYFSLPDCANALISDCKVASDEISSRASGSGNIPEFVPANGRTSWNLLNSIVKHAFPDNKPVFCEWGSGPGLVTLLASIIGMNASGIEIEEELVDLARDFSQQHAIPATFIHASIYPADNPISFINYKDVDLFFAYPWPNQISRITGLFEQVARSGAVLVCYHGGRNYRVLRR